MAQVKFYSKNSLPTGSNLDENGVYFIKGGELYKGAQRFGLGRVTMVANEAGLSNIENPARGDIAATTGGAAWVYADDGSQTPWKVIGGDTQSLQSLWRSDIKSWTSGLVQNGTGSYITSITQDEDGKVKASASNFATDVLEAVGDGASESTSNGVTVSVTTTSGAVTAVSVTAPAAKTWTAISVGDANSYIYNVTQGTDGQVSASAAAFPTLDTGDNDGEVKLGTDTAKVSGWDTVKTDITNLKSVVSYSGTGDSVVTATTGNFTNLNVTDTATFSATEVSTGTLTVGGVSVNNIAAASASDSDAGVAVTVSTLGGGVSAVGVVVTSETLLSELALSALSGKGVATVIRASASATNDSLATEKAVRDALNAFDNAMHFRGVFQTPSGCTDPQGGDIIIIGSTPEGSGYTNGQEFIYNDKVDPAIWEKIGDQSAVTGGGDSKNANGITIGVETAPATASATVTLTVSAVDTAADVSVAEKADNVVTAGAVNGFVTGITDTKAKIGSSTTDPTHGVSATVSLASDADPKIDITVNAITEGTGVVANEGKVVTAGAVAGFVTGITNNKASVGTGNATGGHGISGQVVLAPNAQPELTITVNAVSMKADVPNGDKAGQVVTAGAVAGFVGDSITSAMSYSSTAAVYSSVTTLSEAVGAAGAAIDALKTKTDAYSGGTSTGSWTATEASQAAISTTVEIDATTMAPSVTMAVNVAELQSALGLKAAAYRDVSNSVSDTTSTALVTEGAVATALAWITD